MLVVWPSGFVTLTATGPVLVDSGTSTERLLSLAVVTLASFMPKKTRAPVWKNMPSTWTTCAGPPLRLAGPAGGETWEIMGACAVGWAMVKEPLLAPPWLPAASRATTRIAPWVVGWLGISQL